MPDANAKSDVKILGDRPVVRFCRECGQAYYPKRQDQDFCKSQHREKWHKRRRDKGAVIWDAAFEFRGKRKKGSFTELCAIIDPMIAEEKDRVAERDKFIEEQKKKLGMT